MNDVEIFKGDFRLVMTCFACPEQYDVFKDSDKGSTKVGYLRLRHGRFTCTFPDVSGEDIYSSEPKGDGIFEEDERDFYLDRAIEAIKKELEKESLNG